MVVGEWEWSSLHSQLCQVIETRTLWGETLCRVWLPGRDAMVTIPASRLRPLEGAGIVARDHVAYTVTAARVADALAQDVLLAPIESAVIPLPHQIRALSRAIAHDRVRYLLADEVGLGKTIEAGLVLRELKLRGWVKRTLVVAPRGLVTQWVAEMRTHFGEHFHLVLPEDLKTLHRLADASGLDAGSLGRPAPQPAAHNPWTFFPQVIVSMDAVKPLEKRSGWSAAQVDDYNRERFDDLVSAGWDLVIVDEAHRFGGSTDQVARFKLGQALSEAAPYLLLLSATPHQGKTDAFHRLVSLIDAQAFPDTTSVTRQRVQPYVIRTEKRAAIDAAGHPLFKPRRTQLAPVSWQTRHREQEVLYEAVTDYVREGYNQALAEKRSAIGFLMLLMQRLVVSSTSAIRTTLERRMSALAAPEEQLALFPFSDEEWVDLDGQEQVDALLGARLGALRNERAEVRRLLEAADRCIQAGPDAKAEALFDWLYRLQAEEGDSELKVLVFTEFVPTQEMLRRFLTERGFSVVCLNGSMDMDERQRVQEAFAGDARILISTDAGGEGLNLQFCHVVINYDIPWNPMRLEQRIGRVDRIGQSHVVRALNLVFEASVEHRVREVLEQKLAVILAEFGIDKTGDVLDSAQAGRMFDEVFAKAILEPDKVQESVENVMARVQEQVRTAQAAAAALGVSEKLEPGEAQRLLSHPLPDWVERMTVSYLRTHGGRAERSAQGWDLTWPDGERHAHAVFTSREAEKLPAAQRLTLEDPRVRALAMRLPRIVSGQAVPVVLVSELTAEVHGFWSLWQISLSPRENGGRHQDARSAGPDADQEMRRRRIMPLFLADNGRVYGPAARHIWDQLIAANPLVHAALEAEAATAAFERSRQAAEEQGRPIYEAMVERHRQSIVHERNKAEAAFMARRKAIARIGLPQVRSHRQGLLAQEEQAFREDLDARARFVPELIPLLLIRVEGGDRG